MEQNGKGAPGGRRAPDMETLVGIIGAIPGFGYDELAMRPAITDPDALPWEHTKGRYWTDADDAHLLKYLQDEGINQKSKNDEFKSALTIVMEERRFDPVRDWFEALPPWDGVERAGLLPAVYLGAKDSDYVRGVWLMFMCGLISRTFEPGAKFDVVPVLSGPQGIGKSTFLRAMCPRGEWFIDSISDISDYKHTAEQLAGHVLAELSEMAAVRTTRASREKIKSFLTNTTETYRMPWGTHAEDRPRRIVFALTTNETRFLEDPTGNRRFFPIRCGEQPPTRSIRSIDSEREFIEQAWAEALSVYRRKGIDATIPTIKLEAQAKRARGNADAGDVITERVSDMLRLYSPGDHICASMIIDHLFREGIITRDKRTSRELQRAVSNALDRAPNTVSVGRKTRPRVGGEAVLSHTGPTICWEITARL